jgi:hypothetical protein
VPFGRKTEEEKADRKLAADEAKRQKEVEKARQEFEASPAGRARAAYERGDKLFQYSASVMAQQAVIVAMVGSNTAQRTSDPTVILNSVCNEGWDLVNGSFVFVETGQQSRDKFLSSGQNVAVAGQTVGYYVFRRCEENKAATAPAPWEAIALDDRDAAIADS